ncbi:hypothetical protein SUGI_0534980 [Cryptomeria japonica]|nr:hypothetical protein SUGI_0534980 [Cryptomeria japonica]
MPVSSSEAGKVRTLEDEDEDVKDVYVATLLPLFVCTVYSIQNMAEALSLCNIVIFFVKVWGALKPEP